MEEFVKKLVKQLAAGNFIVTYTNDARNGF